MKRFIIFLAIFHLFTAQMITINDQNSMALEFVYVSANNRLLGQSNSMGQLYIEKIENYHSLKFSRISYKEIELTVEKIIEQNYRVILKEERFQSDDIVISASRFKEKAENQASSIHLIKTADIKASHAPNTADLLQESAAVFVQKSQAGGGSPNIRGFEANRVLLVMDGIRLNNAIYRAGHLQNVISIDPASLDRVEILFGASSLIYGSDALGGVMSFYTALPQLSPEKNIWRFDIKNSIRYASANQEKTVRVDVNTAWLNYAFRTIFSYSDFSDTRMGKNRDESYGDWGKRLFYVKRINGKDSMLVNSNPELQIQSGYRQWNILAKFLVEENDADRHLINFQFTSAGPIPRYDRLNELKANQPRFAEWNYGKQDRLLLAYHMDLLYQSDWFRKMSFVWAYQRIDENRTNRAFQSQIRRRQNERVDVYSFNGDAIVDLSPVFLRAGADFNFNEVHSHSDKLNILTHQSSPEASRYPDGGSDMLSSALYLAADYKWNHDWLFQGGLRLQYSNLHARFTDKSFYPFLEDNLSQKNTAITYQFGAVWYLHADYRLKSSVSSAFKVPNVDDLAKVFDSAGGASVIVPNPNLGPEYTYNYELAFVFDNHKNIRIQTDIYFTNYQDVISVVAHKINGEDSVLYQGIKTQVVTNINADNAYLYGFSFDLKWRLLSDLLINFKSSAVFSRLRMQGKEMPLDHTAPMFSKIEIQHQTEDLNLNLYANFNAWKYLSDYRLNAEDNEKYALPDRGSPAWWTLNFHGKWTLDSHYSFGFGIENILDKFYRVYASGISASGRNLSISLHAEF